MASKKTSKAETAATRKGETRIVFYEKGVTDDAAFSFQSAVDKAYTAELQWPACYKPYNRIRRSDPEVSLVRTGFSSLARSLSLEVELPDDASDDDKRYRDFLLSVMHEMDGGPTWLLDTLSSFTPFMGFSFYEVVPGIRRLDWVPPQEDDEWRSQSNDGLVGLRRLAWRDHSTFDGWETNDNGKVLGFSQRVGMKPSVLLPLNEGLHVTFGDATNPHGLAALEAVWRLERIKNALEIVMGIGFERSAGFLSVKKTTNGSVSAEDKRMVQSAARAVMTAMSGNYALWPNSLQGELMDVSFSAAGSLLDAIRHMGTLKLMVFNFQWAALSATTGAGSYSAMADSSSIFFKFFNAMLSGFAEQVDAQLGLRLWQWNRASFPGVTSRPRITITPLEKVIGLGDLGSFLNSIDWMDFGEEDLVAIRKRSGFLPEHLPTGDTVVPADVKRRDAPVPNAVASAARDAAHAEVRHLLRRSSRSV